MPITVGDVRVAPGDYVVADGTGVVFVAAAISRRARRRRSDCAHASARWSTALREGTPITQVMGKSYETMLKR